MTKNGTPVTPSDPGLVKVAPDGFDVAITFQGLAHFSGVEALVHCETHQRLEVEDRSLLGEVRLIQPLQHLRLHGRGCGQVDAVGARRACSRSALLVR